MELAVRAATVPEQAEASRELAKDMAAGARDAVTRG